MTYRSINAVAESFFGTLKVELLYELPLQTQSISRESGGRGVSDMGLERMPLPPGSSKQASGE